jgi:predicted ATPase/DNA-binding SARP family transcriptional activator
MARFSLTLLGSYEVRLDGEPVTSFVSNKVRALLAYLAVEAERPHRREVLAGLLWPDCLEQAARASLRNALSNLRQAIGDRDAELPFLDITRETIQFNSASDCWLDVAAFTALVEAGGQGEPVRQRLEKAVTLYRGSFLEGFYLKDSPAFDDWCLLTREQLQRLALTALHRLAEEYEWHGELERACNYAWRQVELEPWQEEAHQQLMRLLALSGQRSAALAQYEICRRALMEDLGVEPVEETTALYEHIRDGAKLRPRTRIPPHNLPAPPTPLIGRKAELAEIEDRLQDPACRLLTLVGPGGSGKTRLALEAAAKQMDNFFHGIFFVPLASLQSADAIVPAIAQALGFSFYREGTPQQQLLDYLRQKNMLLVLDNFEHLLDGVGLVGEILEAAPGIEIVITSRARLKMQGEHLFSVAGMDFPPRTPDSFSEDGKGEFDDVAQYDAVKLFLTSARRLRPNFDLREDNMADVVRICRLVQGMPLGILLATAWVEILTPAEVAAQIEQSFDFLRRDWRDVPQRQRSMRAVFDHSWNLLTVRQRTVFQALSVFRGGFTHEAAQQVVGASLRELMALVSRCFLHRTPDGPGQPVLSPPHACKTVRNPRTAAAVCGGETRPGAGRQGSGTRRARCLLRRRRGAVGGRTERATAAGGPGGDRDR